jgi:signal peptide peptidase SppA
MNYKHILSAFIAEPWAMQPEKLDTLCRFVEFKANGGVYSAEELAARGYTKKSVESQKNAGSVAIIPVYGVLAQRMNLMSELSGGTSYQMLSAQLNAALTDDEVSSVVLDIDSPGGGVPGAQELASEILALRGGDKKIIAQVNSLAASAAYWIAASADEINVTPSGRAGSIGVYTVHEDISEMLAKEGVKLTYISAGKYKVEGNETEPLSADTKKFIQANVDASYAAFVDGVAAGRGVTSEYVEDNFGQGRVFGAKQLVKRGMANRVATLNETLAALGADVSAPTAHISVANMARKDAAATLATKIRAGEPITKREFENGIKGLVGCSNAEAERAARLYLKDGQGDPDDAGNVAALAAIDRVLAEAKTFPLS